VTWHFFAVTSFKTAQGTHLVPILNEEALVCALPKGGSGKEQGQLGSPLTVTEMAFCTGFPRTA
jgi:hypothetical protein